MNQNIICIISLCILTFSLIPIRKALGVDIHHKTCSVPKACSNNTQIISFPFYINDLQEPYCGFPWFNVSCSYDGLPVLRLSDDDYIIHEIFYNNHTLRVSNAAAGRIDTICGSPIQNLSLPSSNPFEISPGTTDLILLYNCSSSILRSNLTQYELGCPSGKGNYSSLALLEENPDLGYALGECGNGFVRKMSVVKDGGGGAEEMMRRGFGLTWTASNCSVCARSGGKCGFDYEVFQFRCFCPDRPHARECDISGEFFFLPFSTDAIRIGQNRDENVNMKIHRFIIWIYV